MRIRYLLGVGLYAQCLLAGCGCEINKEGQRVTFNFKTSIDSRIKSSGVKSTASFGEVSNNVYGALLAWFLFANKDEKSKNLAQYNFLGETIKKNKETDMSICKIANAIAKDMKLDVSEDDRLSAAQLDGMKNDIKNTIQECLDREAFTDRTLRIAAQTILEWIKRLEKDSQFTQESVQREVRILLDGVTHVQGISKLQIADINTNYNSWFNYSISEKITSTFKYYWNGVWYGFPKEDAGKVSIYSIASAVIKLACVTLSLYLVKAGIKRAISSWPNAQFMLSKSAVSIIHIITGSKDKAVKSILKVLTKLCKVIIS